MSNVYLQEPDKKNRHANPCNKGGLHWKKPPVSKSLMNDDHQPHRDGARTRENLARCRESRDETFSKSKSITIHWPIQYWYTFEVKHRPIHNCKMFCIKNTMAEQNIYRMIRLKYVNIYCMDISILLYLPLYIACILFISCRYSLLVGSLLLNRMRGQCFDCALLFSYSWTVSQDSASIVHFPTTGR